jgi:hypothetical protein
MTDRILDKYGGHKTPDDDNDIIESTDADAAEDLGGFGWLRGIRDRAWMLELRKKDGNILAVGYGWLERAEFDPSAGIKLHISGRIIQIKGRNLNAEARPQLRLFQGIARHRVPWIQEADEPASIEADAEATVIDSIEW